MQRASLCRIHRKRFSSTMAAGDLRNDKELSRAAADAQFGVEFQELLPVTSCSSYSNELIVLKSMITMSVYDRKLSCLPVAPFSVKYLSSQHIEPVQLRSCCSKLKNCLF